MMSLRITPFLDNCDQLLSAILPSLGRRKEDEKRPLQMLIPSKWRKKLVQKGNKEVAQQRHYEQHVILKTDASNNQYREQEFLVYLLGWKAQEGLMLNFKGPNPAAGAILSFEFSKALLISVAFSWRARLAEAIATAISPEKGGKEAERNRMDRRERSSNWVPYDKRRERGGRVDPKWPKWEELKESLTHWFFQQDVGSD